MAEVLQPDPAVTVLEDQRRGKLHMSINGSDLLSGMVEVDSALCEFDDDSITGFSGISDDTVIYLRIVTDFTVPTSPTVSAEWVITVPTWSDSKQGWYGTGGDANKRSVIRAYKNTDSELVNIETIESIQTNIRNFFPFRENAQDLILASGTKTQRVVYCKNLHVTGNAILKARTVWVEGDLTIDAGVTLTLDPVRRDDDLIIDVGTDASDKGSFNGTDGGQKTGGIGDFISYPFFLNAILGGAGGYGGDSLAPSTGADVNGFNGGGSLGNGGPGGTGQTGGAQYNGAGGGAAACAMGGHSLDFGSGFGEGGKGGGLTIFIVKGIVTIGTAAKIINNGEDGEVARPNDVDGAAGGGGGGAGITVIVAYGGFVNNGSIECIGGDGGANSTVNNGGSGGGGAGGHAEVLAPVSSFGTLTVTGGAAGATGGGGGQGGPGATGTTTTVDTETNRLELNGGIDSDTEAPWFSRLIEGVLK